MTEIRIKEFKEELARLNKKLARYEERIEKEKKNIWAIEQGYKITKADGTKEAGALRRASLDLIDALRELRKY